MMSLLKHILTLSFLVRILAMVSLAMSLFGPGTLSRVFAACTVTGTVYRDYNANGMQDPQEPGVEDITVTAHSETGPVGSDVTAVNGTYTITIGAVVPNGDEIRIEFSDIPPYLRTGPFGGQSATTVTFITCTGAVGGIDLGTANPGEYCDSPNPNMGTTCFVPGDPSLSPNEPALVTYPYTAGGGSGGPWNTPADTPEVFADEVGAVYGLAYQRSTNSYFMSAYLKRHVGFGPGGPGAIYQLDRNTGTVSQFTTVAGVGALPGRPVEDNLGEGYLRDRSAFTEISKMSLGELDISQDDTTLYTVNLNTKALVEITIASGATSNFGIPNPGCTNGQFRPFGLGIYDFIVYVGGVCDASGAAGTAANLEAHIYAFNPNTNNFSGPVLSFALDYPRRCADTAFSATCLGGTRNADWQPWEDLWPGALGQDPLVNPQPILADIEFDNGNMILGFRDRFGDQTGNEALGMLAGDNTLYFSITAGDILRACGSPQTGWTLETGAQCGGIQTAGNVAPYDAQGPGNGEYYFEDQNDPALNNRHDEIIMGGIYQLPGSPDVAAVSFDPAPDDSMLFDAGVIWLSNAAGTRSRSYLLYEGNLGAPNVFGKANGLGSLEATCGPAPLEIGNRVWEDLDLNGRQDPNEVKLVGVTLQLWMDIDNDGTVDMLVGETTTDANGEYYFNEGTVFVANPALPKYPFTFYDIDGDGVRDAFEPAGIMPNSTYEVRVTGGANYGAAGILSQYFATTLNTGALASTLSENTLAKPASQAGSTFSTDMRDSDGIVPAPAALVDTTNFPRNVVVTGDFGENDHTWDFGFALEPPTTIGGIIVLPRGSLQVGASISKSVNPPFALPGDTVTWTITVNNPNSTPLTNVSVTDNMPNEVEIISVSATSGNVSFSGQTVTFNQATMAPGASATITVVTRVRGNVTTPFDINNLATLTATELPNPLTASANVISAGELPGTGESPWSRWRAPILALAAGVFVLTGVWVWRRARR
jgi:uncharacterized repeat protein (TIGR01451 family)